MTTATLPVPSAPAHAPARPLAGRKSLFILAALLIVVALVQAQNMFAFPYYQDAEGTVVSNAWAFSRTGDLSPYTYAYDEAPIGTFVLSLWALLSGGFNTFGFSLDSGRVLMLILHLITTAFLFGITRKASGSDLAAVVACLVFAFSPLAVALQRRVILENIMIVFLLWAVYLTMGDNRQLSHYVLSAIAFGLAVLTKGGAIFFLPIFLYIIRVRADQHHRRFALNLWLALGIITICFYPLYAQMKQELFPQGWLFGGDFPHVSLLERMAERNANGLLVGNLVNIADGIPESITFWTDIASPIADPILVFGGLVCALFVTLMAMDNTRLRPILAMFVGFALYVVFGGRIFNSDAVLLLPFLACAVGLVIGALARMVAGMFKEPLVNGALALVTALALLYPFGVFYGSRTAIYSLNQVDGQIAAVEWVAQNVPADAVVVTDNYAFVELRGTHANTHHYFRVDTDPAIRYLTLNDDPCRIDYMLTTPQIFDDISLYGLDLMRRTVERSEPIATYANNGWPIEIRQVSKTNCTTDLDPLAPAAAPVS